MMLIDPAPGVSVRVALINGPAKQNKALARHVGQDGTVTAIDPTSPCPIVVTFPDGKYRFTSNELEQA